MDQERWLGKARRGNGTALAAIFANSGPSGPAGIQTSRSDFARRKFLPIQRDNPRKWGPGKGEYEREALILSRPPAILKVNCPEGAREGGLGHWFLSHRWERNSPRRANPPAYNNPNPKPVPSSVTASPCHLSLSPLAFGHLPLIKGAGRRDREEAAKFPALCIYYG